MKVSEELQKKIDLKHRYDQAYYNGKPLVTDSVYDLFKDSLYRALPPDHPELDKVGHPPSSDWPKERHEIHMGSQNKLSSEEEITDWLKKRMAETGIDNPPMILQHKIDGFSLEIKYKKGRIQAGITRGDGIVGENVTPNVKLFRYMPCILPIDNDVIVRAEGVLYNEDFDAVQDETGDRYENPRNAAAGISRRLDGKFCKRIRVIAYDVNAKVELEREKSEILHKLGFEPVTSYVCDSIESVLKVYRWVKDEVRQKLPYKIDGLVLKFDDLKIQDKLGIKRNRPEGQIALKFDPDQAMTINKDIAVQLGRSGKLTPVAVLEPVKLDGSTITRATLHNFSYIEEKFIRPGVEVVIEKKGDIIPQVVEVVDVGDHQELYQRPTKCPSCNSDLEWDGVNLYCISKECRERDVAKMVYWVKTLDMKGFSQRFIEKLWDIGKLRKVSDLYKLQPDDFTSMEGIGEKGVRAFFKTLRDSSEMYLEKFIQALGISGCNSSTAAVLAEKFKDWDTIAQLLPDQIAALPGYAEKKASTICEGISEVREMGYELLEGIRIKEKKRGSLSDMSFCVTGSLESMGREEFKAFVIDNGGSVKSTVSAGLTFLVNNDADSPSSKNQKAKKLGVKVITEEEFLKLAGTAPKSKESDKKDQKPKIEVISESIFED